jgi:Tfp pilus assembly PilM family ATPase
MKSLFYKKIPLAISITHKAIRIVQINKNKQIRFITTLPTPENSIVNDSISNPQKIAEVIKKSLAEIHPAPKEVVFSIPDSLCFSKVFTLEKNKDTTIQKNALIELAKTHIPINFEDTYWDYTQQKTTSSATTESYLYVCTPCTVVDPYLIIAKECGLSIHALDTTALALFRLITTDNKPEDSENKTALMILEGNTPNTSFTIFSSENSCVYSGIIPLTNIENYTENVVIDDIVTSIGKTVDVVAQTQQIQITKIILTGELAHIPGIEKNISIPKTQTVVLNSILAFKNSATLNTQDIIAYSVVLGISLYHLSTSQKTPVINLLKQEVSKKKDILATSEKPEKPTENKSVKKIFAYSFIIITFLGLGFVIYHYIVSPLLSA